MKRKYLKINTKKMQVALYYARKERKQRIIDAP